MSDQFRSFSDFHETRVRTCPLTWLIVMHYVSFRANIHFVKRRVTVFSFYYIFKFPQKYLVECYIKFAVTHD